MTVVSLAAELVLLTRDASGGSRLGSAHLTPGVGGALLLELALAERVEVSGRKVIARDTRPVGDSPTDAALARIATERARTPKAWVNLLGKAGRQPVLDQLVGAGILRAHHDKVLLVFPRTRYPDAHGTPSPAEADALRRIRAAVTGTGEVPARTAALCALVGAVGFDRKVFGDLPRGQVRARMKEIGEGAWAADAVRRAIAEVQAAVMAGIVASTTASTAATTS
ncbi:GPP34 family phosphoprotein [Longispora sp. NPDC051575]|uniref:GOLPH3/VPS74 family protein n=1 Tax=Longispora sp. NPDC051575 TaxID=3154943 RepID=UPI00341DEFF0